MPLKHGCADLHGGYPDLALREKVAYHLMVSDNQRLLPRAPRHIQGFEDAGSLYGGRDFVFNESP
jgi:hypothetical protein